MLNLSDVTYFEQPGAPGQYFRCSAYASTLSTMSCAGMFRAEKGRQNGRHPHCNGCAVGASHAGEAPPPAPGMFGAKICPRCTKGATRFVRGICVSCINREYELERGYNAKGTAPCKQKPLMPVSLAFSVDGEVQVATFPKVASRLEAMLRVLRQQPGEVEFSWWSPRPPLKQMVLFDR